MLYVSVPHDKMLDLNRKYWVYDTDDGISERVNASDVLSFLHKCPQGIKGVRPCRYGGMLGTLEKLPDGKHLLKDKGTFITKNGTTIGGCDFLINTQQGVRKGEVINLQDYK